MQLNEIFYFYSKIQNKYYLNAGYKRLGKVKFDKTILLAFDFNQTFNDFISSSPCKAVCL